MRFLISADNDVIEMQGGREPPDDERFPGTVMVHKTCGGFVDVRQTSDTVQAITCRQCGLRVTVPASIQDFGDFRNWLTGRAAAPPSDAPGAGELAKRILQLVGEWGCDCEADADQCRGNCFPALVEQAVNEWRGRSPGATPEPSEEAAEAYYRDALAEHLRPDEDIGDWGRNQVAHIKRRLAIAYAVDFGRPGSAPHQEDRT